MRVCVCVCACVCVCVCYVGICYVAGSENMVSNFLDDLGILPVSKRNRFDIEALTHCSVWAGHCY